MSRVYALENEGRFEGFVSNDPEFIENKTGNPQCFLYVGHTPRWKNPKTGEWQNLRTVWVHFAVFGPMAELVVDRVKKGMRVEVKYKVVSRFHPRWKSFTGFEATLVRPISNEFKSRTKDSFAAYWRPDKPKEGSWVGDKDYDDMGVDALRDELEKRGTSVQGSGRNGRILAADMREALRLDDHHKLSEGMNEDDEQESNVA